MLVVRLRQPQPQYKLVGQHHLLQHHHQYVGDAGGCCLVDPGELGDWYRAPLSRDFCQPLTSLQVCCHSTGCPKKNGGKIGLNTCKIEILPPFFLRHPVEHYSNWKHSLTLLTSEGLFPTFWADCHIWSQQYRKSI